MTAIFLGWICARCNAPATCFVDLNAGVAGSAGSRWEARCAEHGSANPVEGVMIVGSADDLATLRAGLAAVVATAREWKAADDAVDLNRADRAQEALLAAIGTLDEATR